MNIPFQKSRIKKATMSDKTNNASNVQESEVEDATASTAAAANAVPSPTNADANPNGNTA